MESRGYPTDLSDDEWSHIRRYLPGPTGRGRQKVHGVTLEGLLSSEPKHVNVHKPGPGEPPPVTCADLSEAS
jgi:hypothetical protein